MKRFCLLSISVVMVLVAGLTFRAKADGKKFSTLYTFEAAAPVTYTSPLGSQPDTRPVLGPGNTVYGMTYDGGMNGNGVIYRFDFGVASVYGPAHVQRVGCERRQRGRSHSGRCTDARSGPCLLWHGLFRRRERQRHGLQNHHVRCVHRATYVQRRGCEREQLRWGKSAAHCGIRQRR